VLFLDELPEFARSALEALREPLESGRITISRAAQQAEFPARFQLIAAMNPCPCGHHGSTLKACRCTPDQVARYQGKLSGPLLDRIDLQVEVPTLAPHVLMQEGASESTATVRAYRQAAGIPAFTEVRRAKVDALVAACTDTTSDIARTAGVSRRAVTKRRAALGDACAASPFDAETDARREALLAHVAANPDDTVTEAARAVGMSRSRAYAILARQRTKETAP
jgi:magnesium chelatase family protein